MGVLNTPNQQPPGLADVNPSWIYLLTDNTLAEVTATGYLTSALALGWIFSNYQTALVYTTDAKNQVLQVVVSAGNVVSLAAPDVFVEDLVVDTLEIVAPTAAKGEIKFVAADNTGDTTTTITNAEFGQATTLTIPDPDAASASFVLSTSSAGQTVASSTASATPSTIRALRGAMTGTNATMTSGNLVGVRGEVNVVGASGGFLYGAQGKIIATGTLSGSAWTAGVFGQLDISAATINAGQTAAIWGDYGTSSGTLTDVTGMRGVAMTNTTAAILHAQDYRYGNATYLLELAGAGGTLNFYAAAGTSAGSAGDATHCAAQQVIAIEVNGVACFIPVFTQNT